MRNLLKRTCCLEANINSEIEELQRLRSIAENISSAFPDGDKVQGGKKHDRLTNIISNIVDHQLALELRIAEYLENLQRIESKIEAVEDSNERLILRLRYINQKKWDEIAEIMSCSVSNIYKLHQKAFKLLL